ncbi:uncharacterized protein LOC120630643 [Pararge aegeria]|uniref:Jg19634 protein n=1 Tax=Pararge aegeria aegeria TaxID=348720 RepID=A0A8S4S633_9NEOP|nr:uncharacterized protein LOC120630643 [Pararge aegeria]CAH2256679.1 jg19634 [Pararge aegeria aegeria]
MQNDEDKKEIAFDIKQNKTKEGRRNWLTKFNLNLRAASAQGKDDEKDDTLKSKISTLVKQTVHDTNKKMELVSHIKEHLRDKYPYKVGFILSMIKKSKDVLNELFNIAVKHKNDWKALEQLKIFELIVHTNVDTTNLVRQLVEVHLQHLNSTQTVLYHRSRVVLLK